MQIQDIISQVDLGSYALPEFQRGYVWNRDQVKKLMYSLYKGYPIGGLLTWVTKTDATIARGDLELSPGSVNLILDGQQRITSLYGIIKGQEPAFFEGNSKAFTGLYFHIEEEVFEFYMQAKMKDNPYWINLTELMQLGSGPYFTKKIKENPENQFLVDYMGRLNKLDAIKKHDLHIEQVVGEDKTIDAVVEIFNNVNSGGTKLSKGDLALAKICAQWPEARGIFRDIIDGYSRAGYRFELDWFLRCITVYLTGQPYFYALGNLDIKEIKQAIDKTQGLIDDILNQIASRLGLDHNRVLGSRYTIPVMIEVLKRHGGKLRSNAEWNKLLYWYIHTFLWGRYAGSTESVMAQDLNILSEGEGVDGLIRTLRQQRGNLEIKPEDFWGWSRGARFYPLLYLLTRINHAKDFASGIELKNALLGKKSSLEIHHIFPKDILYKAGYTKSRVNSLANYTFLTKATNLEISNKHPKEYLKKYINNNPGTVESHWIPLDQELYEIENYEKFLEKRRELLAESANLFLNRLLCNKLGEVIITDYKEVLQEEQIDQLTDDDEIIRDVQEFLGNFKLPIGEREYEVVDDEGNVLAVLDLAWPDGIQVGLSEPLALMIDEENEDYKIANKSGFRYFTNPKSFKDYIIKTFNGSEQIAIGL